MLALRPPGATHRIPVLAASLLVLAGCGKPATEIAGTVTLDGAPLPDAVLDMFPISGVGKVSVATTDAGGRYRAVVSPGRLSVVILAARVVGQMPDATGGGMIDARKSIVPKRYESHDTTPLVAEPVEGQTTTIDFTLTSSGQ